MFVCYSSVLLFTASLPGRETFMFHYLIDSMSITLPSFHVGSCCVKTTAPMKLSSSRCELPSLWKELRTAVLLGTDYFQQFYGVSLVVQIMFNFVSIKEEHFRSQSCNFSQNRALWATKILASASYGIFSCD